MKPIEFICAQNWVGQAENNLRAYYPTLVDNANRNGWGMINYLRLWWETPQGYDVWQRRFYAMTRLGTYTPKGQSILLL